MAGTNTMFFFLLNAFIAFAVAQRTGQDALMVQGNPHQATFQATLQSDKPVAGSITGVSAENGTGVQFNVNFYHFPDISEGPFLYHIHEFPVPADGNCTGTGGHLDPYARGESPACNSSDPASCQVGDLSGKHGEINSTGSFQTTYLDAYLSTQPDTPAFFGNLSVVVHAQNLTRLNCGNFTQEIGSNASTSTSSMLATTSFSSATGTVSMTSTATSATVSRVTGGASVIGIDQTFMLGVGAVVANLLF